MSVLAFIKSPVLIVAATQLLFTAGDLLARANMRKSGFTAAAFCSGWFAAYFLIRQIAMLGQLYVFACVPLGKSMALFGASSIVISNLLGLLLLGEVLSPAAYLGIMLALLAFGILAFC